MTASRQDLVDQLGLAMQRYQRSIQVFDDAVGRRLGLNPTDLRCLDWLADGPKTAGAALRRHRAAAGRDHDPDRPALAPGAGTPACPARLTAARSWSR